MTILKFKPKATTTLAGTKPARKRKAVLTVTPIPKKQQKKGANYERGLFSGRLEIDGHVFCLDDGNPLGIIAFICNVNSVTVLAPIGPEPITLRADRGYHREIELLSDWDEQTFLKRVHAGMWMSAQSRKNSREVFDWWSSGPFLAALALVPESMRVNATLPRGVYDEAGEVMTAEQIAWRARWGALIGPLKELGAEGPEQGALLFGRKPATSPQINWKEIVRMENPHGPVAINGQSYVAVQNALLKFGFPRMPQTFAELVQGINFVDEVSYNLSQMLHHHDGGAAWMAVSAKVFAEYAIPEAPLLLACLKDDKKLIAELHEKTDWLAVLAKSFKENTREAPCADVLLQVD